MVIFIKKRYTKRDEWIINNIVGEFHADSMNYIVAIVIQYTPY